MNKMNNLKRSIVPWQTIFRCAFLLLAVIESIPIFGQGSLADAKRHYNNKEYSKAVPILKKYAEQGDFEAQCKLGLCYEEGKGVSQDYEKAVFWYEKAANQDYPAAQFNLGSCYNQGKGVQKDDKKAFFWISKAANQNYAYAQYALGVCYGRGFGVTKDDTKATFWMEKAAKQDLVEAQNSLGYRYAGGYGVTQDYEKAEFWFKKAADKGHNDAKKNLEKLLAEKLLNNHKEKTSRQDFVNNKSDIKLDENIPITNLHAENTFAVIIGNENYQGVIKVPFAENDAKTFAAYCEKTLGLPQRNIKVYTNATYGTMVNAISKIKDIATVYKGKLNIIFYYSGHGIPNEQTHEAFLLPTDADGRNTDICYSLNKLYTELGNLKAERVLVLLDACFSGATKGEEMIIPAKGVAIKPKENTVLGNIVVFSAANGKETAYPYEEGKHGMFTYYLLKKIQETKGNITLGSLSDYITTEVRKYSVVVNEKMQTPTTLVPTKWLGSWKSQPLLTK